MEIRRAAIDDIDEIGKLYYDTIVTVNEKDYSEEQVLAWASTFSNKHGWERRMEEQYFLVAIIHKQIVGFVSLDKEGYLDLLYVHKDFQGQGIATKLFNEIEKRAMELKLNEISVQSSITSKPFFEKLGFVKIGEKHKLVNGVPFTNTIMVKKVKRTVEKD